ncbi:hypothetical protein NAT02_18545 [Aeromonas hydrophila]|uniref:hypothetical protein n=1 Tax=Aeromonas hydrophila TaxID=644 RepID=UPI001A225266|nr:hypothetical protein [Aeromonas hydrophila]MCP3244849.1 hypothetical protein [Aeromonas hydrophila]HAU4897203.1 hypothetical protein [Aeromonas hydrophila]
MQPEILSTFAEIGRLPSTVRKIYQKHDVKIRQGSDLEKCLILCDKLSDNVELLSTDELVRLNKAKRLLDAIIACSNEEELKEPLKRISENSIVTNNTTHSMGKDALFELELLQYIKHRRLEAKLGEPDIVVASPYGEYYIACKTINSLNNFEKQLRSGYHQIEKYGKGCIAINLEPHLCLTEPLACLHPMFAGKIISNYTQGIIKKLNPVINKGLRAGRFDGVVFMITCVIKARPGHGNLDSFTQAYFLSDYQNQPLDNYHRFNEFQDSMRGPLSEHVN